MLDLEINVVLTSLWSHADLFGLCVVRVALGLLFVLVVFVFAVIHDSANRRFLTRSDLDEIQSSFSGVIQGFFGWDDS